MAALFDTLIIHSKAVYRRKRGFSDGKIHNGIGCGHN